LAGPAMAQGTIKIAYTDPLSGPFAQVGDANLKQMQYILDYINSKGGALGKKFELVPFDNKSQPSDALIALKSATDQNMPFIMQCSGSNIAAALIDGVNKHNERNPDNRIIYLNCGAVATELTNEQCSFWHFRFDLHVGMKAEVMVRALPKDVTKVYLINQDYLFGQSVQREVKNYIAKLRPDVQVVGDELIPLGKIKDFSPYITKIKAAGAQALITGNWGPDMNLLIKAGIDAGIDLRYYTMYAHLAGGAVAIGPGGDGKVRSVMSFNENIAPEIGNKDAEAWTKAFRDKYPFDFYAAGFRTIFEYLQAATNKAGSVDPVKIALALEGLQLKDFLGYDTTMRKDDHQIIGEYFVGVFKKGVKYDSEKTGLGWGTEVTVLAKDLEQPTTCKMTRPTSN
jgi:branched-chain amino acid transport system substrate-binding protein